MTRGLLVKGAWKKILVDLTIRSKCSSQEIRLSLLLKD